VQAINRVGPKPAVACRPRPFALRYDVAIIGLVILSGLGFLARFRREIDGKKWRRIYRPAAAREDPKVRLRLAVATFTCDGCFASR
jgi:LPXTG-motif cell wall-anchored protein